MKSREKILMQKIAKREKMKKKLSEKPAANAFVEEGKNEWNFSGNTFPFFTRT